MQPRVDLRQLRQTLLVFGVFRFGFLDRLFRLVFLGVVYPP